MNMFPVLFVCKKRLDSLRVKSNSSSLLSSCLQIKMYCSRFWDIIIHYGAVQSSLLIDDVLFRSFSKLVLSTNIFEGFDDHLFKIR